MNPESEWIVTEVPELRIIDDEAWRSVKARQREVANKYANVIEAVFDRGKYTNFGQNSILSSRSDLEDGRSDQYRHAYPYS